MRKWIALFSLGTILMIGFALAKVFDWTIPIAFFGALGFVFFIARQWNKEASLRLKFELGLYASTVVWSACLAVHWFAKSVPDTMWGLVSLFGSVAFLVAVGRQAMRLSKYEGGFQ